MGYTCNYLYGNSGVGGNMYRLWPQLAPWRYFGVNHEEFLFNYLSTLV
jgi:hypothetical protein